MTVETVVVLAVQVVVVPLQAWMLKQIVDLRISEGEVRQQLERIVSDYESEKKTRAESNRLLNDKLDKLTERLKSR